MQPTLTKTHLQKQARVREAMESLGPEKAGAFCHPPRPQPFEHLLCFSFSLFFLSQLVSYQYSLGLVP
jgi:hypothetical protein